MTLPVGQAKTRGAEAVLEPGEHFGRPVLAKRRAPKAYRHAALDAALRDGRTRDEGNLLLAARAAGVPVPVVYDTDRAGGTILLEPIAGLTLRSQLEVDDEATAGARLRRLGALLRLLHESGLTHGDPTTSNVLVPDAAKADGLVLIDFGLGAFTEDAEDRAVDLHLLEEALEATDARAAGLLAAFLDGYGTGGRADAALRRLEAIRDRGRYR
ncbi:MAG: bifunctional N6-L-threonylcarbamoyladenine synthase / protein kinase Bud32 [Thermoplasmata archaeon]|jgi:N6-L-threonylcarbamoyladenine synthase/protein kinase Bud32|nr:bifunctional N6-L-threonylcarbamoyladenine synthase / protein kinase Bud32 [Thermoplasmata archaeon]MEA3165212.1 bifunctional N6-L-threonylcarbamoyladenine synthase / protein kinase Bud32 [Thermoplasmata archaeon]